MWIPDGKSVACSSKNVVHRQTCSAKQTKFCFNTPGQKSFQPVKALSRAKVTPHPWLPCTNIGKYCFGPPKMPCPIPICRKGGGTYRSVFGLELGPLLFVRLMVEPTGIAQVVTRSIRMPQQCDAGSTVRTFSS